MYIDIMTRSFGSLESVENFSRCLANVVEDDDGVTGLCHYSLPANIWLVGINIYDLCWT